MHNHHFLGRILGVGLALSLGLTLVVAVRQSVGQEKTPTAAEAYKNIQVLKDLPATQLFPVMQEWNKSLGVTCEYCHVQGDFTKDTKPEHKATRAMVLLTNKLNATEPTLKKKMTCYTCHHGRALPARNEAEAKTKPAPKTEAKANTEATEAKEAPKE